MTYLKIKNYFDFLFSLILLIITFPLFGLIAMSIKLEDPSGPVIFRQKRIGKNDTLFTLYKFRSMRTDRIINNTPLSDSERMLRTGRMIRKTSLDELPQLINILKGEMSFIGPRPLLEMYLPHYTEIEKKRHEVKPGISGWAQINGRNKLTWEEKFEMDVYYVQYLSFRLDSKIFFLTLKKVLVGSDVIESGHEVAYNFVEYRQNQNK